MGYSKQNFEYKLLTCLILSYGILSAPTPDSFGLGEAVVLQLIFLSTAPMIVRYFLMPNKVNGAILHIFFVLGLCGAIIYDATIREITRDVIVTLYLLLPLVFSRRGFKKYQINMIAFAIMFSGLFFSLKFFYATDTSPFDFRVQVSPDPNYYGMDPMVHFAAAYSLFGIFNALVRKNLLIFLFFIVTFIITVSPIFMMLSRAPLILLVILFVILSISLNWRIVAIFSFIFIVVFNQEIFSFVKNDRIVQNVLKKFLELGSNGKLAEIKYLLDELGDNIFALVFGKGFGGSYVSPTIGEGARYLHNFPFTMLLKFGLFGFLFSICYFILPFFRAIMHLFNLFCTRKLMFEVNLNKAQVLTACVLALSSSLFLQANHRSLSFALIAAILLLTTRSEQTLENSHPNAE